MVTPVDFRRLREPRDSESGEAQKKKVDGASRPSAQLALPFVEHRDVDARLAALRERLRARGGVG